MSTFVAPVVANHCIGTDIDGNALYYMLCQNDATDTKQCVTMKKFLASCGPGQYNCSAISSAYVASVTVCNQNLYVG